MIYIVLAVKLQKQKLNRRLAAEMVSIRHNSSATSNWLLLFTYTGSWSYHYIVWKWLTAGFGRSGSFHSRRRWRSQLPAHSPCSPVRPRWCSHRLRSINRLPKERTVVKMRKVGRTDRRKSNFAYRRTVGHSEGNAKGDGRVSPVADRLPSESDGC